MSKKLPNKKINKKEINNNSLDDYDLLPITIDKLLLTTNDDPFVLLNSNNKKILFDLNNMESSMLTFIESGCEAYTHIRTIYHLYVSTLEYLGTTIKSAIIEAKDGDIWYGRLCLTEKNNKQIYCQCTVGDAIVLSALCKCELLIVKKVLDEADAFEEEIGEDIFYDES